MRVVAIVLWFSLIFSLSLSLSLLFLFFFFSSSSSSSFGYGLDFWMDADCGGCGG